MIGNEKKMVRPLKQINTLTKNEQNLFLILLQMANPRGIIDFFNPYDSGIDYDCDDFSIRIACCYFRDLQPKRWIKTYLNKLKNKGLVYFKEHYVVLTGEGQYWLSGRIALPRNLRLHIFQRDKGVCIYCTCLLDHKDNWEVDHIIPVAKGGTDDLSNLILSCRSCNRKKHKSLITKPSIVR